MKKALKSTALPKGGNLRANDVIANIQRQFADPGGFTGQMLPEYTSRPAFRMPDHSIDPNTGNPRIVKSVIDLDDMQVDASGVFVKSSMAGAAAAGRNVGGRIASTIMDPSGGQLVSEAANAPGNVGQKVAQGGDVAAQKVSDAVSQQQKNPASTAPKPPQTSAPKPPQAPQAPQAPGAAGAPTQKNMMGAGVGADPLAMGVPVGKGIFVKGDKAPVKSPRDPVHEYAHRHKHGKPLSNTGKPPVSRQQAIAIGLSKKERGDDVHVSEGEADKVRGMSPKQRKKWEEDNKTKKGGFGIDGPVGVFKGEFKIEEAECDNIKIRHEAEETEKGTLTIDGEDRTGDDVDIEHTEDTAKSFRRELRKSVPEKYSHINFTPPASVARAARRGLEMRKKAAPSNKGGLTQSQASKEGIGSGVARATSLANRQSQRPGTIKQMASFFARHGAYKHKHTSDPGGKAQQSWLQWGGDPGLSWANKIKRQMEAADNKEKMKKGFDSLIESMLFAGGDLEKAKAPRGGGDVYYRTIAGRKVEMTGTPGSGKSTSPMPDWLSDKIWGGKGKGGQGKGGQGGKKQEEKKPEPVMSKRGKYTHEAKVGDEVIGVIRTRTKGSKTGLGQHHAVVVDGKTHEFPPKKAGREEAFAFLKQAYADGKTIKKSFDAEDYGVGIVIVK